MAVPPTAYSIPSAGDYSDTDVAVSQKDFDAARLFSATKLALYPSEGFRSRIGQSGVFRLANRNLLAGGAKEGVVYLMDADIWAARIIRPRSTRARGRQRQAGMLRRFRHLGRRFDGSRSGRADVADRSDGRSAGGDGRRSSRLPTARRRMAV